MSKVKTKQLVGLGRRHLVGGEGQSHVTKIDELESYAQATEVLLVIFNNYYIF